MGAAIGVFDGARALRVPRTRFAPVKTTDDLLVAALGRLRARPTTPAVELAPERHGRAPVVDLDPAHFKLVGDFEARFAGGRAVAGGLRARCRSTATSRSARGVVVRGDGSTVAAEAGAARRSTVPRLAGRRSARADGAQAAP